MWLIDPLLGKDLETNNETHLYNNIVIVGNGVLY
jgi:hypothetical protein